MTKKKNPTLQELFEANSVVFETENGKTSALYIEEALRCVDDWITHKPTRAMILEEDGYTISLVKKRELIDTILTAKSSVANEKSIR